VARVRRSTHIQRIFLNRQRIQAVQIGNGMQKMVYGNVMITIRIIMGIISMEVAITKEKVLYMQVRIISHTKTALPLKEVRQVEP